MAKRMAKGVGFNNLTMNDELLKAEQKSINSKQARNWCFTLNNYTSEDEKQFIALKYKYLVYGREVGKEGTPHLQGYVEFNGGVRFGTLTKWFPRAHWEPRWGTASEAAIYCKKSQNVFEDGVMSTDRQGKRSDLDGAINLIKEGAKLEDLYETNAKQLVTHGGGLARLINSRMTHRKERPNVIWLWGTTGTGKTHTATSSHKTFYIKDATRWWDNYNQEEAIVIDDFDGTWPFRDLLRLLDKYHYSGQVKGGYVKINSPYIYITCEFPPEYFWMNNELAQVMRRIKEVRELKTRWIEEETKADTDIVTELSATEVLNSNTSIEYVTDTPIKPKIVLDKAEKDGVSKELEDKLNSLAQDAVKRSKIEPTIKYKITGGKVYVNKTVEEVKKEWFDELDECY